MSHIAAFCAAAAAAVIAAGSFLSAGAEKKATVRIGHFPNVTHAQGLAAHQASREKKGWFEQALGADADVQWFTYNAGPSAMEAIFAGALDLAYVGPNPALNAYIKSGGAEIRIVAGACSGGAALVVQSDGRIKNDADFKGKRVATPQLGNTQDVAARAWLRSRGMKITLTGGDATVIPTPNPDQLALFASGDVDAVWTVEPWVSRLEAEAKGKIYLEESSLWKETGGRYVTTLLVASASFVKDHGDLLKKCIAAHADVTAWIHEHPADAKAAVSAELKEETSRAISPAILDSAWKRLELTIDPVRASLAKAAADAKACGFLKSVPDLEPMYALDPLRSVLKEKGLPPIP